MISKGILAPIYVITVSGVQQEKCGIDVSRPVSSKGYIMSKMERERDRERGGEWPCDMQPTAA